MTPLELTASAVTAGFASAILGTALVDGIGGVGLGVALAIVVSAVLIVEAGGEE